MKEQSEIGLEVEELEERIAPGTLAIMPRSGITDGTSNTVSDRAMHGLNTAQANAGGVITWTIG